MLLLIMLPGYSHCNVNWKIYYGDGSTYSDQDGSPEEAQKVNCLAIVQTNDVTGHSVEHTTDYYCWFSPYWRGCDIFGLWDYLSQPGVKVVLFGRWVSNEDYKKILQRALKDPDIPKRSAWLPNNQERRE